MTSGWTVNPLNKIIITSEIDMAAWALVLSLIVAEKMLNIRPVVKALSRVKSRKTK